jgi:hypothetical protein
MIKTSADNSTSAITVTNQGQAAPATDVSDNKGSTKFANKQAEGDKKSKQDDENKAPLFGTVDDAPETPT